MEGTMKLPVKHDPLKEQPGKEQPGKVLLHWQHVEDEREWPPQERDSTPVANRRLRQWLRGWAVPLVLFGSLIGAVWYQAQAGVVKIEAELQAAVDAEPWLPIRQAGSDHANESAAWQAQLRQEATELQRWAEPDELVTNLEVVNLGYDWATVRVEVQRSDESALYRQTRVYQKSAQGWSRIAPTTAYWGRPQQLESRYFIFHYFSQDAAAVADHVERYDDLYAAFYTAFFQDSPSGEKLVVKVDPTLVPRELSQPSALHNTLIVASQAAILAPAELSAGDLFAQSLALALFEHLALQASWRYELPDHWRPVRNALRLWLIWEQELPLAVWREPLVRWVFRDPEIATLPKNPLAPAFAHKLCADHWLWMAAPIDIAVPVICLPNREGESQVYAWRYHYPSPVKRTLHQLMRGSTQFQDETGQMDPFSDDTAVTIALATVIEYADTTYEGNYIATLLATLPEHETLETLIPAAVGVSLAEFDAGWHTFLAEQYGLSQ